MDQSVAYHEAGHALAMLALMGGFHAVSIEADPTSLGRVTPFSDADRALIAGDLAAVQSAVSPRVARTLVSISCAGAAGELVALGYVDWDGCAVDFATVARLVDQIDEAERAEAFGMPDLDDGLNLAPSPLDVWHHTVKDVAAWLNTPEQQSKLAALAQALADRRTLTGAESRVIVDAAT